MDIKSRPSTAHHKTLQKSTTLNRKFVQPRSTSSPAAKPVAKDNPKLVLSSQIAAENLKRRQSLADKMNRERLAAMKRGQLRPASAAPAPKAPAAPRPSTPDIPPIQHPHVVATTARQQAIKSQAQAEVRYLTAKELKDRAVQQALQRVSSMDSGQTATIEQQMVASVDKKRHIFKSKKLIAAISMSAILIALLGYLVHLNLPDLSIRVAAMQTGIDGSYPGYIPPGFHLNGLVSKKDDKIVMTFSKKDQSFTITEEKSSWDSAALLSNHVLPKWGDNYITAREQGLTIYISGSNAVWTSGGILYSILAEDNILTGQQIHDIATSL